MIIAVTGASGYLAWSFINLASTNEDNSIIAISSNTDKIKKMYNQKNVVCFNNDEYLQNTTTDLKVDTLVHTAFARESNGKKLVGSLGFLTAILEHCKKTSVKKFINISSQSVYGSKSIKLKAEDALNNLEPEYLYALAKCASEILVEETLKDSDVHFSNLRLASLIGPSYFYPNNIVYKFILQGLQKGKFKIVGGKQNFSFLDVRDAVMAIYKLACSELGNEDKFLNLGAESNINIKELGNIVKKVLYEKYKLDVDYDFEFADIELNSGMDSSKLYNKLSWKPKYSIKDTITNTAEYIHGVVGENK